MASALLVCGSRTLTRDPDRLAWVTETLRAVLSPRPDLLVHGGARGPDEMADAEAARVQVPDILTFYPNGTLRQRRVDEPPLVATYHFSEWHDGDPGPLVRNRAMVMYVSRLAPPWVDGARRGPCGRHQRDPGHRPHPAPRAGRRADGGAAGVGGAGALTPLPAEAQSAHG